jgi:release factor glutamine methyltransferase
MSDAMAQSEVWSVSRLLTWTTEFLKRHGSESPRLDAEVLLAHAMECKRIDLYTRFEEVPDDVIKAAFREMVKRRSEGSPVAYLVGHKEFYSLPFYVNSDCLIPRPETEHLVMTALDLAQERFKQTGSRLQVIDVCTGSGCIAVAFAKQFASADITAIDIDAGAFEVARRNIERHNLDSRIRLHLSDLLEGLAGAPTFDLILSNPPYVSDQEYKQLHRSVREYEPRVALVAGHSGLEVILRLEEQAYGRLLPGGSLLIELSPMIAAEAEAYFNSKQRWSNLRFVKDLSKARRVLVVQKPIS